MILDVGTDVYVTFALERAWDLARLLAMMMKNPNKKWASRVVRNTCDLEPEFLSEQEARRLHEFLVDGTIYAAFSAPESIETELVASLGECVFNSDDPVRPRELIDILLPAIALTLSPPEALEFFSVIRAERGVENLHALVIGLRQATAHLLQQNERLQATIEEISNSIQGELPFQPINLAPPSEPTLADYLMPRFEIVPFIGREADIEVLRHWLKSPQKVSVACISGEPGAGKTRLAMEIATRAQPDGWLAGFMPVKLHPGTLEKLARCTKACVLVVDDSEWRVDDICELLDLRYRSHISGAPLRVILTCRIPPSQMLALIRQTEEQVLASTAAPIIELHSGMMPPHASSAVWRAASEIVLQLGIGGPNDPSPPKGVSPLELLVNVVEPSTTTSEAFSRVVAREVRYVKNCLAGEGVTLSDHQIRALFCVVSLCSDSSARTTVVKDILRSSDFAAVNDVMGLRGLLQGSGRCALRPDAIAERCLLEVLERDPSIAASIWKVLPVGRDLARAAILLASVVSKADGLPPKMAAVLEKPLSDTIATVLSPDRPEPMRERDTVAACLGNLVNTIPQADVGDALKWPGGGPGVEWLRAAILSGQYSRELVSEAGDGWTALLLVINMAAACVNGRLFDQALEPARATFDLLGRLNSESTQLTRLYLHSANTFASALHGTGDELRAASCLRVALETLPVGTEDLEAFMEWMKSQEIEVGYEIANILGQISSRYMDLGLGKLAERAHLAFLQVISYYGQLVPLDQPAILSQANSLMFAASQKNDAGEARIYLMQARQVVEAGLELDMRECEGLLASVLAQLSACEFELGNTSAAAELSAEAFDRATAFWDTRSWARSLLDVVETAVLIHGRVCSERYIEMLSAAMAVASSFRDDTEAARKYINFATRLAIAYESHEEVELICSGWRDVIRACVVLIEGGDGSILESIQYHVASYFLTLCEWGVGPVNSADAAVVSTLLDLDFEQYGSRGSAHSTLIKFMVKYLGGHEFEPLEQVQILLAREVLDIVGDAYIPRTTLLGENGTIEGSDS